jgi:hypothetical protein
VALIWRASCVARSARHSSADQSDTFARPNQSSKPASQHRQIDRLLPGARGIGCGGVIAHTVGGLPDFDPAVAHARLVDRLRMRGRSANHAAIVDAERGAVPRALDGVAVESTFCQRARTGPASVSAARRPDPYVVLCMPHRSPGIRCPGRERQNRQRRAARRLARTPRASRPHRCANRGVDDRARVRHARGVRDARLRARGRRRDAVGLVGAVGAGITGLTEGVPSRWWRHPAQL